MSWFIEAKRDFKVIEKFGPYATEKEANEARKLLVKAKLPGVNYTLPLKYARR